MGEIPARLLTDECPRYEVAANAPARRPRSATSSTFPLRRTRSSSSSGRLLFAAASSSSAVTTSSSGSSTVRRPGLDAAVAPAPADPCAGSRSRSTVRAASAGSTRSLGGALAVFEAARNVACVGGEPIGFTNCLNFGNPEKPEVGWELSRGDRGHRRARARRSASRSSPGTSRSTTRRTGAPIYPTPVVGGVGLVEDVRRVPKGWRAGDVLLAAFASPADARGLASCRLGTASVGGTPPPLDLEAEARLVSFLCQVGTLCTLVHDASEGGLAVCLVRGRAPLRLWRVARSARRPGRALRRGRWTRGHRVRARDGLRRSRVLRAS